MKPAGTKWTTGVIFARQSVTGTYNGVGDMGTVDIQYLPALAERPSSLSEVSGIWSGTDGFEITGTLMVGQSGELDYSDTDGCTGLGQLDVLDPTLNGFQVQWDWNCPNIPPWIGPSSGLAFVDDFYFPGTHWIVFGEALLNGAASDFWFMERPEPVAAGGIGSSAAKSGSVLSPKRRSGKSR